MIFDRQGRCLMVNRPGLALMGLSEDEVLEKKFSDLWPRAVQPKIHEKINHVRNGISCSFEALYARPDGEEMLWSVNLKPLYAGGEKLKGFISISTDIGDHRRIEDELERYRQHLQELVDQRTAELKLAHEELEQVFNVAAEGIIVIGKDCDILNINDRLLALLGISRGAILGKKCHEIIPSGSFCHTDNCPLARTLRGEEDIEFETEKTRSDGIKFPCIIKAAPFRSPEGEVIGIVESIRDISARKKMEEMLLKIRNLESISILAGGVAHDFNNLLQGILGNISIAAGYLKTDDMAFGYIEKAQNISEIAKGLTGQLLTFSRLGEPVKEPVDIAGKLGEWVSFALSGTNVKAGFEIEDCRCVVEADEGQMRQVIQNLVLNAKDAMPDGGSLTVAAQQIHLENGYVAALEKGTYMKIFLKDEGTGISEEIISKIFDPYFSTKNTGSQRGTGLGLAICHSIIKKHGGAITVGPNNPSGTVFTVFLPVSGKESPEAMPKDEERKQLHGRNGKVLVMDDEEIVIDVARIYLKQLGYECETAKDGIEAVEMYKNAMEAGNPFDMVILDLTVPGGKGGIKTIAELLKINPGVKALASSGYSKELALSDYRQYGFLGILTKPYTLTEFDAVLARVSGHPRA